LSILQVQKLLCASKALPLMPHEIAMHIFGCSCGLGDVKMTPSDYLKQCVLKRFKESRKERRFSSSNIRKILLRNTKFSKELETPWKEEKLFDDLPVRGREPLLCPYEYPVGTNTSDEYRGKRMRAGFFMLKFQSPFNKYYGESEIAHLIRISKSVDDGFDLKPYLYYAHWHGELLACPCLDDPIYLSNWDNDSEGGGTKDAFTFRIKDETRTLVLGKTENEGTDSPKRCFNPDGGIIIGDDAPSVWFSTARVINKQTVYEKQYNYSSNISKRSFAYGRKFSLVIPDKQWDKVQSFLPPHEDPKELRCWGEDDSFDQEINGVEYVVIYGRYNTTARRILNDLCHVYKRNPCFATRGSITVDVIDQSGKYLGNSEDQQISLPKESVELNLLITNRRKELLQKLYIFRTRIFSKTCVPMVDWVGEHVKESDSKIISGGCEFMIDAKETVALSLKITNLRKDSFSIDFQELEAGEIQRELSHTSLDFRREADD